MAIAYSSTEEVRNAIASATITINKPSGVADGDLMLAMITWASATVTVSAAPAGWTHIRTTTGGGANNVSLATYWKIASGEGASYQWTISGAVQNSGAIWRITGAHGSAPADANTGNSAQGQPIIGSAATTAYNDELVCLVVGLTSDEFGISFPTPSGYTAHNLIVNAGAACFFACEKIQAGAGTTGAPTINVSAALSTNWWAAQIVTFRPPDPSVEDRIQGSTHISMNRVHGRGRPMSFTGWMNKDVPPPALTPIPPTCWWELPRTRRRVNELKRREISFMQQPLPANAGTPSPSPSVTSTQSIGPRISLLPGLLTDDAQWKRQAAAWMAEINKGHMSNVGILTLQAGQSSTVVVDDRTGPNSFISFMPRTANAAAEIRNGTLYVTAQAKQTFTVAHSNNAQTDRTYIYTILG